MHRQLVRVVTLYSPPFSMLTEYLQTGNIGEFNADATQVSVDGGNNASPSKDDTEMTPSRVGKPPVGTEEWHKIRKDNHKEGKDHSLQSSCAQVQH